MSPPRIVVVGTGAMGTRHIESLARLDLPFTLDVVDPDRAARGRAIEALRRAGAGPGVRINEFDDPAALEADPAVGIIATASRGRRAVVEQLLDRGARRLILEKVLFTRLDDYEAVGERLAATGAAAWVNCPRRGYPGMHRLAELVRGRAFEYVVEGSGWGLACNLVHYLDEFAALAGRTDVALSADGLAPGTVPSKRPGYIELLGTVTGSTGEYRFAAHCTAGGVKQHGVSIRTDGLKLHLSHREQTLTIENGTGTHVQPYPKTLQSETTHLQVRALLEGADPGLPDYATSARLHCAMLDAFLTHLRRSAGDDSIDECPIT